MQMDSKLNTTNNCTFLSFVSAHVVKRELNIIIVNTLDTRESEE